MMKIQNWWRVPLVVVIVGLVGIVVAEPGYTDRIPNGDVYSCNTCHGSGYSLNTFGTAFRSAGSHWTQALSQKDSDGGGVSNGGELMDPDGEWSQGDPDPGDPSNVTNPGASGDDRVGVDSSSWGRIKAEGF